jgi:hypothetical protein
MNNINAVRGRCYTNHFAIKAQRDAIDNLVATYADCKGEVIRTKNVRSVWPQVDAKTRMDYCGK